MVEPLTAALGAGALAFAAALLGNRPDAVAQQLQETLDRVMRDQVRVKAEEEDLRDQMNQTAARLQTIQVQLQEATQRCERAERELQEQQRASAEEIQRINDRLRDSEDAREVLRRREAKLQDLVLRAQGLRRTERPAWLLPGVNVALVGRSGCGKTSLVEPLLRLAGSPDLHRAPLGEALREDTMTAEPYVLGQGRHLYDHPGGGTENFMEQLYVDTFALPFFDACVLVFSRRFTSSDAELLRRLEDEHRPVFLVRTMADVDLANVRFDNQPLARRPRPEILAAYRTNYMQEINTELQQRQRGPFDVERFFVACVNGEDVELLCPELERLVAALDQL